MEEESGKKTVKVCFVSPKAYPLFDDKAEGIFGGAEVDLYMLGTELAADDGFDVSFVVADYGQEKEKTIGRVKIIKSIDFGGPALCGAVAVWRAMKKAGADVYVIKTASAGVPLVAAFCRLHKKAAQTGSSRPIRDNLLLCVNGWMEGWVDG